MSAVHCSIALGKRIAVALTCLVLGLALCLGLAACQSSDVDPLQQPMAAASEDQLLTSLLALKQSLSQDDYQQLLQAVATLRTYDLAALSVEQYLATLDGQTPLQIMAAAEAFSPSKQVSIKP